VQYGRLGRTREPAVVARLAIEVHEPAEIFGIPSSSWSEAMWEFAGVAPHAHRIFDRFLTRWQTPGRRVWPPNSGMSGWVARRRRHQPRWRFAPESCRHTQSNATYRRGPIQPELVLCDGSSRSKASANTSRAISAWRLLHGTDACADASGSGGDGRNAWSMTW
jgi:hypothetical protein